MSRALRVAFPGAWYHVSNRGAGRQRIFRNDDHRQLWLELVGELCERFALEVHAFCLMSNRYDLVLRTPHANLPEAMRHLNGVYTQRYNRLAGRDGPLFRGRYRAIVFEAESCLLPVTRQVHRRPLVTGTVPRLDRYRWSSYPTYVTRRRQPAWLRVDAVQARMADPDRPARAYRQYVEREGQASPLVRAFYRASRPGNVLGPDWFREEILRSHGGGDPEVSNSQHLPNQVPPDRIVRTVARFCEVRRRDLLNSVRGRLNEPRLLAIWLARTRAHMKLAEIADYYGMAGYGSASAVLHRIRHQMRPPFWRKVAAIEALLDGGEDATPRRGRAGP